MKKLNQVLLLLSVITISLFSCKKENTPPTNDNPEFAYRLIKYELINYVDTTNTTSFYKYEDDKLKTFEHIIDPGLHAYSYYSYGEELIVRVDTNFNNWYYDSVGYSSTEYALQDNHIVKATRNSNGHQYTVNYIYTGDRLAQFEIFDGMDEYLVARGQYTYSGDQLLTYEYYQMNYDDEMVLSEKNEYTYINGKPDEVFYYYSSIYTKPPELSRRLKYVYNGNLAVTVDWYDYTSEEQWKHFFQTRLTYNADDLVSEAAEYSIYDGLTSLRYQYYFDYEVGTGNLDFLRTSNTTSPRMLGVIPQWGLY